LLTAVVVTIGVNFVDEFVNVCEDDATDDVVALTAVDTAVLSDVACVDTVVCEVGALDAKVVVVVVDVVGALLPLVDVVVVGEDSGAVLDELVVETLWTLEVESVAFCACVVVDVDVEL